MKKDSGYLSVLIGVSILSIVTLASGGVAYSFYQSEIAQVQEESSDLIRENNPIEQLETEKNIVPLQEQTGGSQEIDLNQEGIPIGTYSNPPTRVNSFGSSDSTEINRPLDNFDSAAENNRFDRKSISSEVPDYNRPSSSNDFNRTSNNSLLEPLDNSDFLEIPNNSSSNSSETPSLTESPF